MRLSVRRFAFLVSAVHLALLGVAGTCLAADSDRKVMIFVWDGLRPDSINPTDTPNLHALRETGVDFTDNHATYPTFTMINAASFATGALPASAGHYGNTLWQPGAAGMDSANKHVNFQQPVFVEDYGILTALTNYLKGDLLLVGTLFEAAHKAKLRTAAIGKTGAAYIQDYKRGDMMLDEKAVLPLALAKELQSAGFPLPATAPNAFAPGELVLSPTNGSPIAFRPPKRLNDGVSFDPTDTTGSPYKAALQYLVDVYLNHILPKKDPALTVLWIRDPDTSQHNYGVGSPNARDALRSNDRMLGQLRAKLKELGQDGSTDILVVSDHGHSNVAGASAFFPLRAVVDGAVGAIDATGHSVSGIVRLADLMRRAGFVVFDGMGCSYVPVASGIRTDGTPVYPTLTDGDGKMCGKPGQKYTAGSFVMPSEVPTNSLVIAVNGGSDYLYAPDHDPATVRKAVAFLQSRSEIGAIFVDSRYGDLPGTLPLTLIRAENTAGRSPDIIASYDFDEDGVINGMKGTEYAGALLNTSYRGMHGSFSRRDVHATLIAYGPDFRERFKDPLPSGNVDVAPTVARILGLPLPGADGRPLLEAMRNGPAVGDFRVNAVTVEPKSAAVGVVVKLPTDPDGKDIDAGKSTYTIRLQTRSVTFQGRTYHYFDRAKAIRQ